MKCFIFYNLANIKDTHLSLCNFYLKILKIQRLGPYFLGHLRKSSLGVALPRQLMLSSEIKKTKIFS